MLPRVKIKSLAGVKFMESRERCVFVIGAGFSAPANLPIQNRILKEITQPASKDFLSFNPEPESIKLMIAFIRVGLYLLQNYTLNDCSEETEKFSIIEHNLQSITNNTLINNSLYRDVQILKETVRARLEHANLQISLEDVFTSFDKSYQGKEYLHQRSYHQISDVKDAIMRLFVYYFSKRVNSHSYNSSEYLDFCNHIKKTKNVTIISTNWDVLIEEYFTRENIHYSLCLNEPYFAPIEAKRKTPSVVNLIKMHGSINWFKCLNCGTLNIVENKRCGLFLFDDHEVEHCTKCKCKASNGILLQSEIITPTMIKTINSQLYSNLWSAARRDLMEAKSVTFIGYSLPIADFEFRYLLQRSIPAKSKIEVVLHQSSNPNSTDLVSLRSLLPERRYRDLFAKNHIEFYYDGFADYFSKLLHSNS